jgi:hypothetical protein
MTAKVLPFQRPVPAPQKRLNLRDICDLACVSCRHVWVAPIPLNAPDCPRCHVGVGLVVAGSIRRENAVRVN